MATLAIKTAATRNANTASSFHLTYFSKILYNLAVANRTPPLNKSPPTNAGGAPSSPPDVSNPLDRSSNTIFEATLPLTQVCAGAVWLQNQLLVAKHGETIDGVMVHQGVNPN